MTSIVNIPQPGDTSLDVGIMQAALNAKGYNLKEDNYFGPVTRAAVSLFQKSVGLVGTGVPGEKTIAALGLARAITRDVIASEICNVIWIDINSKLREIPGKKNRSPRIDSFNRRALSYMGAPYCASGGWCAIDDACSKLGLVNPVPPTASSQAFRKASFVPAKYIRADGELGKKGDVAVLQSVGNPGQGHYTTLGADQKEQHLTFPTLEYNTDGSGSRDGDGAYAMTRSIVDRSKANSGKIFVCFTDIPQWILDHNQSLVQGVSQK